MKPKILLFKAKTLCTLGLSAGLLTGQPLFASPSVATDIETSETGGEEPVNSSKDKKNILSNSRSNPVVKIYPDIIQRSMHVVAKDGDAGEMDFFVFDLQGTLVQNFKLKKKDRYKIAGLAKGKYIYRVFAGDEEAVSGQFEIR